MSGSHVVLICALLTFVLGALPFAVWVTRIIAHSDASHNGIAGLSSQTMDVDCSGSDPEPSHMRL
jgi:hypothetical protein